MEKKWDTVIPADLKRLFVSGTYVPLVRKGLSTFHIKFAAVIDVAGFKIYANQRLS
jgi:hypothetical protein